MFATTALLALLAAPPAVVPPPRYDASIREARISFDLGTRRPRVEWVLDLAVSPEVRDLPLRLAIWEIGPSGERRRLIGEKQYDVKASVNCPDVNFCNSPMSKCTTPAGGCQVSVNGSCQTGVCDPEGDGTGTCGSFSCLCKVETTPCGGGRESRQVLSGWLDIGELALFRLELTACASGTALDPGTGVCTAVPSDCSRCVDVDPEDNARTVSAAR